MRARSRKNDDEPRISSCLGTAFRRARAGLCRPLRLCRVEDPSLRLAAWTITMLGSVVSTVVLPAVSSGVAALWLLTSDQILDLPENGQIPYTAASLGT